MFYCLSTNNKSIYIIVFDITVFDITVFDKRFRLNNFRCNNFRCNNFRCNSFRCNNFRYKSIIWSEHDSSAKILFLVRSIFPKKIFIFAERNSKTSKNKKSCQRSILSSHFLRLIIQTLQSILCMLSYFYKKTFSRQKLKIRTNNLSDMNRELLLANH